MLLDSPFGEHIRFTFQVAVIVQDFQRAEQVVAGVLIKGKTVRPAVD